MTAIPNIRTDFESGNFIVQKRNNEEIIGSIYKDMNNKDFQWFYFFIENIEKKPVKIRIKDILQSSYPSAWQGYQVCIADINRNHWERVDTQIDGQDLIFTLPTKNKQYYVSYFIPYSLSKHCLINKQFENLNTLLNQFTINTRQQREVPIFQMGRMNAAKQKNIWIIGRQHPGETIVGWFMEKLARIFTLRPNFLDRLFQQYQFFIVPNVNPDGVALGTHRTNGHGIDPNRDWFEPTILNCPEIKGIRDVMQKFPPYIFLDIHGDERTLHPYMLVNSETIFLEQQDFLDRLCFYNSLLEIRKQSSEIIDLSIGRHFVSHCYQAFSMTLELPCQYHKNMTHDLIKVANQAALSCLKAFLSREDHHV